jgi:hypothetical protein
MKNLLYISLILLLFSCTKEGGNFYFEGRVYNPVTGAGIPGIEIKLVKQQPLLGDVATGGTSKVVKSVVSDANGNFKLVAVSNLAADHYYLTESTDAYKMIGWENGEKEIRGVLKGKEDYDNLRLVPYGNNAYHFKNVNCIDENDSMSFNRTYLLTGETNNWSSFRTGCYDVSGDISFAEGDYRYDWYVIRSGVRTDSSRIFTVQEGQTTHVEVFY